MKFYKCKHCGKIIAIVNEKPVPTICCGEPMVEMVPNTEDGAHEKHIPIYKVEGNIVKVQVGSVEHPMVDVHYIQFIVLEKTSGYEIKYLKPNEKPYAEFILAEGDKVVACYEYCNLHGLWKIEL